MEKINLNTFGNKLKYFMWERSLTGRQFSKMTGIADNTISSYIQHDRIPQVDYFMRMARALELSDAEIVDWIKTI